MRAAAPNAVRIIRDPRDLEALRSPVRQQMLAQLEEHPRSSVAELSRRLGMPAESLYYHLKKLLDVGLVRASGRRPAGRRYESLYELCCPSIEVDPTQRSEQFLDGLREVYLSALRAAGRRLARALDSEKAAKGRRKLTSLRQRSIRLSARNERRLRARLAGLDQFLERHDDPRASRVFDVTTVLSVRPAPGSRSGA